MIERPSKADNNLLMYLDNNDYCNYNNIKDNQNINANVSNSIPTLNSDCTYDIYFKENTTYPNIYFPSMSDKNNGLISAYFMGSNFFIYFIKAIFALINYSSSNLNYSKEYFNHHILNTDIDVTSSKNKVNSNALNNKILSEILYYNKYCQGNVLVSFGNNNHYETCHKDYKYLSLPRII